MKSKIFLIFAAILPVLLFMAGCGGGYAEERYNPNEQHVYVHYEEDPWVNLQNALDAQQRSIDRFSRQTDRTYDSFERGVWKMNRDNRDMFNILNGAQLQDNMYRQQRQQRP